MELAIDKAKTQGLSGVTVRRLRHLGGWSLRRNGGAEGCAATFTAPPAPGHLQAPSRHREAGHQPIMMAFPSEEEGPILSDFATCAAARQDPVHRARGKKLPDGWLLDKEGRPATSRRLLRRRAILPVGAPSPQGYCLAFMTDLFGSLLSRTVFPPSPRPKPEQRLLILVLTSRGSRPGNGQVEVSMMVDYVKETPWAGFDQILTGEKEPRAGRTKQKRRGDRGRHVEPGMAW